MPVKNSIVNRDGIKTCIYAEWALSLTDGHPIGPGVEQLKLNLCKINGHMIPYICVYVPVGSRVFFFEGPFLVLQDTSGNETARFSPSDYTQ